MTLAVKDKDGQYYCGCNAWDKQLRKAKIYTFYKMAVKMRDDARFMEHEALIVRVEITEYGYYNPDMEY